MYLFFPKFNILGKTRENLFIIISSNIIEIFNMSMQHLKGFLESTSVNLLMLNMGFVIAMANVVIYHYVYYV